MSVNYILSLLTPLRIATLSATVSSSAFLFGNAGCSIFGPVPYILQLPPSSDKADGDALSAVQRAKLWAYMYKGAMPVMIAMLGSSVVAFSTAAYLFSYVDATQQGKTGKTVAIIGAVISALVPPFTVFKMAPTNKILLSVAAQDPGSEVHAKYVDRLLVKWRGLHLYREVAGVAMLGCALTLCNMH
ncbi:hypothetical protein BCR37DRAFT_209383 [Protomyces lactucae-debilis]|uniref:DUF1772-domain-containing protein n=1 Tax=Protomyces lactucae-debilis TaxID=2754530 RepID=A0A1Y2FQL3_PROLT|nr:uncharacterized protein BCR37DRAFT_209383 [Protomyces lactucae-debilis]ORY86229.1 hypothetical protein BCR37DRAFT_209383 [Protomyces lactucae-debilis]